jgi:transcriptional regulator with XRE-family HTH domain
MDVAKLRETLGVTRKELARILCVDERTVYRWETDEATPAGALKAILQSVEGAFAEFDDHATLRRRVNMGIGSLIYQGLTRME